MNFLQNKTIIVTGASSGIGFELSKLLIEKFSCKVIAIARNKDKLSECKKELGNDYIPVSMDVSKEEEWVKLGNLINTGVYKPNVLINNAGIMLPFIKAENYDKNDFDKILKTDLFSVIYSVLYVVPYLYGEKGLVNVSSSSSLCPVIGQSGYCTAKSAVKSFTEVLQTEADYYVGLIMPGFCKTNIMRSIEISDKEKKLVDAFSSDSRKCALKILKAVNKKRRRKVIGIDAKLMNFLYKLSPKNAGRIIAKALKKSRLHLFDDIQ